jgi:hypothetical protein
LRKLNRREEALMLVNIAPVKLQIKENTVKPVSSIDEFVAEQDSS